MNIHDLKARKIAGKKISMVTCYDAAFASVLERTEVDLLLVGDSVAMVMHGFPNTLSATPEMMALHTAAVSRGAPSKWIVGDMPFLSTRKGKAHAVEVAGKLLQAGAHAIKIEGIDDQESVIDHLVKSGIPVVGHLGLTPQFLHALGGMKVQGKDDEAQDAILKQSRKFEKLGACALVLECIPEALGAEITSELGIPTIGIGAGRKCDGQVLVLQDLLGFRPDFRPKFLRHYLQGSKILSEVLNHFHDDVIHGHYPSAQECYFPMETEIPREGHA
jgi:3-methyl-2-oxobutanoate hydroxymethyltransferase